MNNWLRTNGKKSLGRGMSRKHGELIDVPASWAASSSGNRRLFGDHFVVMEGLGTCGSLQQISCHLNSRTPSLVDSPSPRKSGLQHRLLVQ